MRKSSYFVASAVLGVLPCAAPTAMGALTDSDSFDYTGTTLNGQNGGTGWNGGWFATGTLPSVQLSNDGASLSYPASFEPPATTPPSSGSRVSHGGLTVNASSSRLLADTFDMTVEGNTMYASALFQKNAANGGDVNSDNVLLEFVDSLGNRRFGLGIEGTGDRPWLNAGGSATGPDAVTAGETYFLVAKVVSSASGSDTAFLKVFGTDYASEVPVDEPSAWDATVSIVTGAVLDRVRIRIDPGNTSDLPGEVDDIRIGTDWASVAAVPEPSSLALLGLGGLACLRRRRA